MQDPKDKTTITTVERAFSELTKGLEGMQLLNMLEQVSYENEVEQDYFGRWVRTRRIDGSIATNIVQMNVLHHLTGRFRRGQKVAIGEHVWNDGEAGSKDA